MAVEDQLLGNYMVGFYGGVGWDRVGQLLDIWDRTVFKLAFKTRKIGAPPASTITFTIRKFAGDVLVASKLWGTADNVPVAATWLEVTFDTPVYVNEKVRILMEWAGAPGNGDQRLAFYATNFSVKAGENVTRYTAGAYGGDVAAWDATYSYTYDLPVGM